MKGSFAEMTEACCCGLADASSVLTFCTCADELKHVLIINIKQTCAVASLWNIFSLLCKFLLLGKMLHSTAQTGEFISHDSRTAWSCLITAKRLPVSFICIPPLHTTVTSRWLDEDPIGQKSQQSGDSWLVTVGRKNSFLTGGNLQQN